MSRRRARCSSSSASSSRRWFSARKRCRVDHSPYTRAWRMKSSRLSSGVDAAEGDEPVGDQRYAVQRDALVGHHGRALLGPVRLAVGALDQVGADPLGPLGLDRGVLPGPQPPGLDELAGHQVRRVLAAQPAAREDREPRAAGAEVLPRPALAGSAAGVWPVARSSSTPTCESSPDSSAWWIPSASYALRPASSVSRLWLVERRRPCRAGPSAPGTPGAAATRSPATPGPGGS